MKAMKTTTTSVLVSGESNGSMIFASVVRAPGCDLLRLTEPIFIRRCDLCHWERKGEAIDFTQQEISHWVDDATVERNGPCSLCCHVDSRGGGRTGVRAHSTCGE
jgi:hypothetical protein